MKRPSPISSQGRQSPLVDGPLAHKNGWANWLDSLAPWTHAVTLTCKRKSHRNHPITDHIICSSAKHVVRLINTKCFGKGARKGASIAVAATYGWGTYGLHPHLHFCFAHPKHLSYEAFSELVDEAATKTYWIDRERCTKPYLSKGWASYLIQHGTDQLILDLVTPSASCRD